MVRALIHTVLLLLGITAPAVAYAQVFPAEQYKIVSRYSEKCLDVLNSATGDGATVAQYDCHGGDNQQWQFQPVEGPWFRIVSRHSGKVLDAASVESAAPVYQWGYWGGWNQHWRLESAGGGWYNIVSRLGGKTLEVVGVSLNSDTVTKQYANLGGWNQQFRFEQIWQPYGCTHGFPADYLVRDGIPVDMFGPWDVLSYQESWLSPLRDDVQISFSSAPWVTWWKVMQVLDAENNVIAHFETEDAAHGPVLSTDVLGGRNPATLKLRFAKKGSIFNNWHEIGSICGLSDKVGKSLRFHWYED